jgi:Ser/Thr protein kinase RdoA (MazF antagonist)
MMVSEWVTAWCRKHLGAPPSEVLFESAQMSQVFGLRLADGREVAVKARPDQDGREATCVEVQRFLAAEGFPAAAPLTGVTVEAGVAIHAEEWLPGGEIRRGDDPATAKAFARLLARLVTLAADIEVGGKRPGAVEPPLPNPEWIRWDDAVSHAGAPPIVAETARRVRDRMSAVYLPRVLGHGDWETQNLRWRDDEPYVVHDWDSLCWLPEAAIAGAACGAFASAENPTLAPIASSEAFLDAYQRARRPFDDNEIEVAWAVSLWPALHNARGQEVALKAVEAQAEERLERAGA